MEANMDVSPSIESVDHDTSDAAVSSAPNPAAEALEETTEQDLVEEELLVEEISIDGMCGVY
jgi:mycofactocin precursor